MYSTCTNIRREGVRAYECGLPAHGTGGLCGFCQRAADRARLARLASTPGAYVANGVRGYRSAKPGRWRTRRVWAWYGGAFGLGVAAGTAVGMLLEALRQAGLK